MSLQEDWIANVSFLRKMTVNLYADLRANLAEFDAREPQDESVYPLGKGQFILSPNTDLVPLTARYIIIHATGSSSFARAISLMTNPTQEGTPSAHLVISRSGQTTWLVPPEFQAWHAGRSSWNRYEGLNTISFGIELENAGPNAGYPKYTRKQMVILMKALRYLMRRYNIPPEAVLGHCQISPHREDKADPYHNFPWRWLEEVGLAAPWVPVEGTDCMGALAARGFCYGPGPGNTIRKTAHGSETPDVVTDSQIVAAFQRRYLAEATEFGVLCPYTRRFILTGKR